MKRALGGTSGSLQFEKPAFKFPTIEPLLLYGRFSEAVSLAEKLLADDPENYAGWRVLYEANMGAGDFRSALDAIERAITLKPDNSNYQKLKAFCQKEIGDYRSATPVLEKLHVEFAADTAIIDALKVCHYKLGNTELAIKYGALKLQTMVKRADQEDHAGLDDPEPQNREKMVVAFSLWGRKLRYCFGAMINARLVNNMLPNWVARFYIGEDVPDFVVKDLRATGAEIVLEKHIAPSIPNYMWRFLIADDSDVARYICRDTDSRISAKELAAVDEWVKSPFMFHIIRDHIFHNDLILAGLWGGVPHKDLPMSDLIEDFQRMHRDDRRYGVDQAFLGTRVWPLIRQSTLSHDSYYAIGETRLFPCGERGDEQNHVGLAVVDPNLIEKEAHRFGLNWSEISAQLEFR